MAVLGLDVGTTRCKAIVVDSNCRIRGYASCDYPVICPRPGYAEQDPDIVWEKVKQVIADVVEEYLSESVSEALMALGISVQGDAIIPVDQGGNILYRAILGMDRRTVKQCEWFEANIGAERTMGLTGMPINPVNSITKIMWIRDNLPDVFSKTWKFLHYEEFILMKLGADPVIDYSMASRSMAFDLSTRTWSTEILQAIGIEPKILSEVAPSGSVAGKMNLELARSLGFTSPVTLCTGGHDQACAALGAGVITEGQAIDSIGTAEVIGIPVNRPMLSRKMMENNYPCYYHVKEGMFFIITLNQTGGLLLDWYKENFASEEVREAEVKNEDVYKLIMDKAPSGPSSIFFLPHLVGSGTPWCDSTSKGAIVGLTFGSTRHDIVKGIIDSLNYELKINLDLLSELGIEIQELRAVGGGARSPVWMQTKADILGKPVVTLESREAACLGAAMLAGCGTGEYKSLDEAVSSAVRAKDIYYPDMDYHKKYMDRYLVYKEVYPTLARLNEALG